ncbi:unnamed protein product [Psylliodes chrysocephalus]|uniref:DUF4806 domain-containing protein n=1 Tax=Psylliodes chrysocephalus TaxID=3402493 RepID=A0A9P0CYV9_9CUCU|nr:unnamed protein product [Psylliodes chrysocephala]
MKYDFSCSYFIRWWNFQAKMFAVVEFENRDCALLPLAWLFDNQKKTYWPRVAREETFLKYVKNEKKPQSSWATFAVNKILFVTGKYENAAEALTNIVKESNSSEENGSSEFPVPLVLKYLRSELTESESDESSDPENSQDSLKSKLITTEIIQKRITRELEPPPKKVKLTKEKAAVTSQKDTESSEEFSSEEETNTVEANSFRSTPVHNESSQINSPVLTPIPPNIVLSTPNTSRVCNETILRKLERVIATQDQQTIMLQNILRTQQSQNIQYSRPDNYPELPVTNKKDFKNLESFLKDADNFVYMKTRLACIGGVNVRNCTMHIIKHLLSNEVAIKFNWAGRDKRPIKNTNITKVIFGKFLLRIQ